MKNMQIVECDEEEFYISKAKDNRINFHVGYTEFTMSKKEVQELIKVLREFVVRG